MRANSPKRLKYKGILGNKFTPIYNANMTTVPQKVTEIINRSPYYKDGLKKDIINLSALAREIQPEIEKELIKNVSEASIVMALKRLSLRYRVDRIENLDYARYYGDISLKSGLFENTYKNSETLFKTLGKVLTELEHNDEDYFTATKGIWQTTIIAPQSMRSKIEELLCEEELIDSFKSVTAITLRLRNGHISVPGVCEYPLKLLVWQGINIVEVVSTFDELTVILDNKDVDLAFGILNNAIINKRYND